jgi:hypothetical protein
MIKSRGMGWTGHVARMGEERGAYIVFVGKGPLGRFRCKWEDNTKIYLGEVGWGCELDLSGSCERVSEREEASQEKPRLHGVSQLV